jgi:hypothetical protein
MIGNSKTKKLDSAEAVNRMLEAAQQSIDNEHGPQLSAADWALVAIALQLVSKGR